MPSSFLSLNSIYCLSDFDLWSLSTLYLALPLTAVCIALFFALSVAVGLINS